MISILVESFTYINILYNKIFLAIFTNVQTNVYTLTVNSDIFILFR